MNNLLFKRTILKLIGEYMIKRDLNVYRNYFNGYTELRVQENRTETISIVNGNIKENSKNTTSGISARVFKNGCWGFASNANVEETTIKNIIKSSTDNALFMDKKLNKNASILPSSPGIIEKDLGTRKNRISQKEKIDFIKTLDSYISDNYTGISSRNFTMKNLDMEKNVLTSDGGSLYTLIPRSLIFFRMTMVKNGDPVNLMTYIGGSGQFEDAFSSPEDYFKKIDDLYGHLRNKSEAIYSNAGYKDCILDSKLTGDLAHEAIGHPTEADSVLGGSIAANYLEKKVASPLVTLVDYANNVNGETCPLPVYVDDEGVKSRDAVLIENGILKGFMHNKETANHFGVVPTGNARAFKFSDEPLIRMRNTAILPGKHKLQDMISSIEDGYYLISSSRGQADTTSEFMFGVSLGYEIKNGKLGKTIKDTTISGVAFDMLKTISMLSDDMSWTCEKMCGKKQMMPVAAGGPAIKCKLNIGGK